MTCELIGYSAHWGQAAGFVILVIGTLVYDKGDVIAAKRVAEESATGHVADHEAPGGVSDVFAIPPGARSPTMAVAFSPSTAKPSMSLNAHSMSSSLSRANEVYLASSPH